MRRLISMTAAPPLLLPLLLACSPGPPAEGAPEPRQPPAPVQTAPEPRQQPSPAQAPPVPTGPSAPWAAERLPAGSVPTVYLSQWMRAENRAGCALLAPLALGKPLNATPRAASFAGGWAVAYDLPELRSAYGVAGTGTGVEGPSFEWPFNRRWSDGSFVGYGPEGGTGPNELAYLRIPGQSCLYNVWSRLGRNHLEYLLERLRYVDTATL
ncbi:MAG: hypothetical protein H0U67_09300 [Gemmatimonadetes bacterium]|nr:hypothetical protein [Gemmatimonadota bacterium]